jgi:xylulokinase
MGERTPHLDPDARAALVGLAADHTRANVIRAILEGVAFSLKDTLTIFKELGIPVRAIRVGGGGARSPLWRQIQADVYGQAVETVQAEEGAAYGAALLAGVGAGRLAFRRRGLRCGGACGQAHGPGPGGDPRDAGNLRQLPPLYPALRSIFPASESCSLLRYRPGPWLKCDRHP